MKKLTPAIIISLLLPCICFAFFIQNKRKGETVISIKDVESSYTFKASFYSEATPGVTRYMDSCTGILRKENASFHIKISDGDLTITVEKQENSVIVISHIRKMCQGIGDILIQN